MSSDLFVFDGSSSSTSLNNNIFQSSSPDEADDFLFSPFSDSAIDILEALSDHQTVQTQLHAPNHSEPITAQSALSPPNQELQNLTLRNQAVSGFALGLSDHFFRVKTEQCFDHLLLQRSLSSNSFEQKPCSSPFSPSFDNNNIIGLVEPHQGFQGSPETGFFAGQMRRVCSAGDLQARRSVSSAMEEASFKVGKYSAEERKERISKYRAKRTLRNFNKTIKYACRKTLADNRPRIRGRFARNDEPVVSGNDVIIPKAPSSSSSRLDDYDDDDLWLEGLNEEEEDSTDHTVRGQFLNSYGPTQFQYFGF